MLLPKLSDAQIAWAIQLVAAYIGQQRQSYRCRAAVLNENQKTAMEPFFSSFPLDSTRVVVLSGERVSNPAFYGELISMGFEADSLPDFELMAAITFVDTVVSHEPLTNRLLFHELVHVVQYEKLGLAEFAAKYVTGFLRSGLYEAIPLERNAYELDARFVTASAKPFSVSAEVQQWIDAGTF